METFRFKSVLAAVLLSLACVSPQGTTQAATQAGGAAPERALIEHVTPRRDYVGKMPTELAWTAVKGVDTYSIAIENEIEIQMFEQDGIKTTSVPWPKELRLDAGTYFWRIIGLKGDRIVADSGRAAFLVRE